MHPPRRLPQPIRNVLWFTLIGAVVGAAYGHMIAVSDGAPLLCSAGVPRGAFTGVVITGILFSLEQLLAQPAMAKLRRIPFSIHLALKTAIYLVVILFACFRSLGFSDAGGDRGLVAHPAARCAVLLAAVLVVRFIDDVNHLLGQNVL